MISSPGGPRSGPGTPVECEKIAYQAALYNHLNSGKPLTMHPGLPRHNLPAEQVEQARSAARNPEWIGSRDAAERAANRWRCDAVLGIDTEFVRERTFHARPGLVQISNGEQAWLLDVVALPHFPELGEMLADRTVCKVLHSVGEDLDVLQAVGGALPRPLFDTQIAAAMLGMPLQSRYENLVEAAFGVELVGGKARNDWCRRPLADSLLAYAAEDVAWLPALKERLENRLEHAGRLAWHREDCERIVAGAGNQPPALSRVKGAGRLDDQALACLQALSEWREDTADRRDLPRRFVLGDDELINLATAAAKNRLDTALGELSPRHRKRYGEAIERSLTSADSERFERPAWLDTLTPEQRERVKAAQQAVGTIAEELGIEPAVIASKKELTRLVRGERPDWLDGWRGNLLAGRLEAASVSIVAPETADGPIARTPR